ncbi:MULTISPECIES: siderophore ABC transporter substrate-binding protein [Providencia]|uniref:siderophore ABC transporter substrate-binding protein n=1 Tax=Providencia TaxID=586 RepID=UPI0008FB0559|nr:MULTISPECIES: ABC transporter substrate-binding protein [Providencia]APC10655.1 putative ABC transporter solute-binding protein YclQ precursor [Providencia rettgeri]AVL74229.1 iron ABC transporter substrate-binding protein [Providencia rettgeri]EKH6497935.1 ABC transporter substrate-binding protein [Providencia rettgeri]EKH6499239.1 ABC transporter substrate-binding protein [Providencia rettgeri]ELR5053664.1 ABC transporter substrate-binding protein [Providencia rettgeri]
MKKFIPAVLVSVLSFSAPLAFSAKPAAFTPNVVTAQGAEKVTIKHLSGETEVAKKPQKVVLFDFGVYDSMQKLGLGDKVVALPTANAPAYVKGNIPASMENAGGMKQPDLAKIALLKPDLIVITGRQGKSYEALSNIAPTINLGSDSKHYMESVKANLGVIGELYGNQKSVDEQLVELDKTIADAQKKAADSNKKVLVLMHNDGKLIPNNQAVVYNVVKAQRAELPIDENADKSKRRVVDSKAIAQANPDVILIIDRSEAIGAGKLDKTVFEDTNIQETKAYKDGKITYLQSDLWYLSGGGLVSLTEQVNAVVNAL